MDSKIEVCFKVNLDKNKQVVSENKFDDVKNLDTKKSKYNFKPLEKDTDKKVLVNMRDVQIGFYNHNLYTPIVKDLNLDIYEGEILGLVGESGCGKSTTARLLVKMYEVDSGEILFSDKISGETIQVTSLRGVKLKDYREKIKYIFQFLPKLFLDKFFFPLKMVKLLNMIIQKNL